MAKKLIAVIGLGQFGRAIVEEFVENGMDVLAIDNDETSVKKVATFLPTVFVADSTNEKALIELGIKDVDIAIVAFGSNLEASVLTTVILKELGIPRIIVRVDDDYYINIMKKLGATEIITPQRAAGIGLANRLGNDDYRDYYELDKKYSVVSIEVNEDHEPETISILNPKAKFGLNLVLINRNGKSFIPGGSDMILPKDWLFVVGSAKAIRDFSIYVNNDRARKKRK